MMKEYKRDKRVLIPRDEFEEEAGEGLGQLSREEAEADFLELRARMERRLRRPRAIWLPAAAAIVILLVGSALLVSLLRERSGLKPDVALAEEIITDTAYIAMALPVEKQNIESPASGAPATAAIRTKEAKYGPLMAVVEEEVSEAAMADEIIVADEQKADDDVVYMVSTELQEVMAEEVVVQAIPQVVTTGMAIRSKTTERETVAAAGARKDNMTVEDAAKKDAAVADAAGKREAAAIEVAAEGRKDAVEAPAGAAAVTGAVVPDSPASPVGGWSDYREYVSRNIRYPDGFRPVIRQEVMVSFTIRTDSTVTDLKILRSPGEAFTSEAFRLLREGPKWVPPTEGGKMITDKVVLMFVFR